jgi:hypothetical protein
VKLLEKRVKEKIKEKEVIMREMLGKGVKERWM